MPRALAIRHFNVPSADRETFTSRARASRAHYSGAGCHYWLYEESGSPGAYVEFFEAPNAVTLQAARAGAPDPGGAAARLYLEVELV
jgi:hypothetical protein